MTSKLKFVHAKNPIHRVNPEVLKRLVATQAASFSEEFSNAHVFAQRVLDDVHIRIAAPTDWKDEPANFLGDLPFSDIVKIWTAALTPHNMDATTLRLNATNLAQRTQLLRAFLAPDHVIARVATKVGEVVSTFPRSASDIECGRNAGDVIDPYIIAASQYLLHNGNFQSAIESTVAHKALMIIEGLMGHLHEEVIGEMRGNIKAPEPRGVQQEIIDLGTNPFPGADVVQPPDVDGEPVRLHQVKSKTGSAKGGDGKRLGEQLRNLRRYYQADVFYDALIGNTLRGHRSMNAVLAEEPAAVVLVGQAAFRELTRSSVGPDLLLRVYQNAFVEVATREGYAIDKMAAAIVTTFKERAAELGESFLEIMLHGSTGGDVEQQDSRRFERGRRRRRDEPS